MAAEDLNLDGIRTVDDIFRRNKNGADLLILLRRLGFWVDTSGDYEPQNPPRQVAKLTSNELGDKCAYWQSELSRVIELIGVVEAERYRAELSLKKVKAQVAADKLRTVQIGDKVPNRGQLNDFIEETPQVIEADEKLAVLVMVSRSLKARKESLEGICKMLSREITRRGDELKARI